MKKYIVVQEFADKNNLSVRFKPGDELPESITSDEKRLQDIISRNLAAAEGEETTPIVEDEEIPQVAEGEETIDLIRPAAEVISKVRVFMNIEKLRQYLVNETAAANRKTVVDAITARITALETTNSAP